MILNHIKKYNISDFLLLLILLTLPLKHNFNSIAIILFVIYSCFLFFKTKEWKSFTFLDIIFGALFLYMGCSYSWATDKEAALEGITRAIPLIIFPLIFNREKIKNREKVLKLYVLGIFLFQLFCLLKASFAYFKGRHIDVFFYHNLSESLFKMNAIYLSVFVAFSYFILFFKHKVFEKKLRLALILFNLSFLLLLSSKNIIVTVFVISLVFLFKQRIKKKYILLFLIVLLPFSIKIKERITEEINGNNITEVLTIKNFGDVYKWKGISLRLFQNRIFFELIQEVNLVYGLGLNSSQERVSEKYKKYGLYKGFYNYNLHNQYTQLTLELGIIGLVFLFIVLFIGTYNSILNKDKLYLSILIVFILLFFTESYLWRQRGIVFFVITNLFFFKRKSVA